MNPSCDLLLVEDDELIRAAVAGGLRLDGHLVREAVTLSEARACCADREPQLVLLDVALPDGNGLDLLAELRSRGSRIPVLVLTARGTEEDRVIGFEHGCDDYVVKPFSLREVRLRIAALLRRAGAEHAPARVRIGAAEVDVAGFRLRRDDGDEHPLSPKELEMLRLFLAHPGRVIARDEFLREVWGYDRAPLTRTVDMHVRKLREKIETDAAQPRHLITVHGAGYRYDP